MYPILYPSLNLGGDCHYVVEIEFTTMQRGWNDLMIRVTEAWKNMEMKDEIRTIKT